MRTKLLILLIVFSGLLASCIDRFFFNGDQIQQSRIVIEGVFTNESVMQQVIVSKSSSVELPEFIPVSGCMVVIEDDRGNKIILPETSNPGYYSAPGNPDFAQVGTRYRVKVKVPGGGEYASSFEVMLPCPKVGPVYYEIDAKETSVLGENEKGIQFYADFKGDDTMGRFFRWNLEETWEYHSTWPVKLYVDRFDSVRIKLEDFSNFVCYKAEPIRDIFTLSTVGLTHNIYNKYPLHFVSNKTQRLLHRYSLLIKQYSLSEGAYAFWEDLRKNNKENVSLYGQQPSTVNSNIRNLSDSTETVLGYFGVSSVTSKRVILASVPGLTFDQTERCQPFKKPYGITSEMKKLRKPGLDSIPIERPLYYFPYTRPDGSIIYYWGDSDCFFCKLLGGTTEKPSYWDDK